MINYQRYSFLIINICIILVLIISYHVLTNPPDQQTIVSVNITQLTQDWISSIASKKLSKEETTHILTKQAIALESTLQELSFKYHWIIFSSTNVVTGAPDMTNVVLTEVNKKLETLK